MVMRLECSSASFSTCLIFLLFFSTMVMRLECSCASFSTCLIFLLHLLSKFFLGLCLLINKFHFTSLLYLYSFNGFYFFFKCFEEAFQGIFLLSDFGDNKFSLKVNILFQLINLFSVIIYICNDFICLLIHFPNDFICLFNSILVFFSFCKQ